ncbi:MAG: hypothetical protein ACTS5I_05635, partial [Rhodanobacter sp.]
HQGSVEIRDALWNTIVGIAGSLTVLLPVLTSWVGDNPKIAGGLAILAAVVGAVLRANTTKSLEAKIADKS